MKSGWFVTLIGLLLLALLIWWLGPYLGLGSMQPLASPVARLLTILLLVIVWAAWLQIQQLRHRNKASRMSGELAATQDVGDDQNGGERAQLYARFQEAVQTLRKTRRGGSNLYTLPWYVVIGPPGSGKSTLLKNSGLNFPLADRFGKQALRGIGGTRNCDWWFTDEAVFLDTAGRYITQDSDRQADGAAWTEFLKLLRRYRRRRPVNGVIVSMSMSDLIVLDEAERDQHVQAIRRRLDEMVEHLRIGVPVYMVFTKCDLVAGFTEFFDDLNPELRSQVWGMSFPVAKTMDGSAARMFADEFNLLLERLNSRLLDRLHVERDRLRRAAVLSFPQQFAALGETARQFVEGVFAGHAYGAPLLLRGVYLTSGTQEGTPIDRMMGAVARTFGLDDASVHAPGMQSRTFFVERLLKEVLFKESGFAGTNPRLERRKAWLQVACYAGVLLATVLLVAGMAGSYARNSDYLAQVQTTLQARPASPDPSTATTPRQYFALSLTRLEAIGGAVDAANLYRGHVPLLMRLGLYQGHAVGEELHDAYLRELNATLLPGIAAQFRHGLTRHAADPQALYYYLKGYLMLGQPAHVDADELGTLSDIEWRGVFPDDPVLQKSLAGHFHALLAEPGRLHTLPVDAALVEQARNTLRSADLSSLVYGSFKLGVESTAQPPLQLDKALGLLGNVFRRRSGTPLSEPLPALYTQSVFASEAGKGIGEAVDQFVQNDWVFGAARTDTIQKARLAQQVQVLYEQDYIKTWDALLADLQLQPAASIQDASAIAAKLGGPSSPLKLLLGLVRDNTTDLMRASAPDATASVLAKAASVAQKKAATNHALAAVLGGDHAGAGSGPAPGQAISEHFATLNKLGEGAAGAAPIDHVLGVLDQLSKTLLTMTDFSASQPNPQLLLARQEATQLPPPVAGWIDALTGKSEALVASGTQSALGDQVKQAIGTDCADFTRGRYPFDANSQSEIPLQNFGDLFGNGGRFDSLYRQSLEKLIDVSGKTWRWKSGPGAVAGPPAILAQVQAADRIRQMYFRGGSQPEVGFTLLAPTLGEGVDRLLVEIDGQKYDYRQGGAASMTMKWPGPTPGHVTLTAYDAAGKPLGTLDYLGEWSFFRALQAARLKRQSDLRFNAEFDFGGHVVQLPLQAGNLKNPFLSGDVQRFRCGG
ncbi:type VI secretion system membrane subunit TssM [Luteibacter rhizovicinus]|nr:type VI secretion system membrane subunit TssM [Luteibacter rhizovicinus]